jgi:hypothetical protein
MRAHAPGQGQIQGGSPGVRTPFLRRLIKFPTQIAPSKWLNHPFFKKIPLDLPPFKIPGSAPAGATTDLASWLVSLATPSLTGEGLVHYNSTVCSDPTKIVGCQ